MPPHLKTLATLPWEVQNSDFSAIFNTILIKQLTFQSLLFLILNYGSFLAYITVSVQSDILSRVAAASVSEMDGIPAVHWG